MDRLASVEQTTNGTTAELYTTYTYDVAGNKIEEDDWSTGGVTTVTRFAYEAERPDVYADLTGNNSIETWYVRPVGADALAARVTVEAFTCAPTATFTTGSSGSFTILTNLSPAPTFSVTAGGLPPGLTLSSAGVLSGTPTGAGGMYGFTVTASNGTVNISQYFRVYINVAPAITSAASATFKAGAGDGFTFVATGFPRPIFSVTGGTFPAWLALSPFGVLTMNGGTPGVYSFTVTAYNGTGTAASQNFTLTVASPVNQAPAFTNPNNDAWPYPLGYFPFTFTATGFPTPTFSSSNLPSGFTLTSAGFITSSPTTGGIYPFTVIAANGVNPNATQNFTATVYTPPLFTSTASTSFTVASLGSFQLTATAAYPAAVYTVAPSTPLPTWLTLSSSGLLSGTPPTGSDGTYNFVFAAHNILGDSLQAFTLTVNTGGHGPIGPLTPTVPTMTTPAWYLTDHVLTVRALTDATGVIQDRITYDPYGLIVS